MRLALVLITILVSSSTVWAADAAPTTNGPKLLTADTPSAAAKPKDPNAMPQEYVDLRREVKNDYNAWMKEDQQIGKDCAVTRTNVEIAACAQRRRLSQKRLDAVHAKTRDMQWKIDNWRRQLRGLPPELRPDAPPPTDANGNTIQPKKENSVLLPQNSAPLPANTF